MLGLVSSPAAAQESGSTLAPPDAPSAGAPPTSEQSAVGEQAAPNVAAPATSPQGAAEPPPAQTAAAERPSEASAAAHTAHNVELNTQAASSEHSEDTEASAAAEPSAGPSAASSAGPEQAHTKGWNTFVSGYFRAPMAIGVSPRPGPDNLAGDSELQLSYGPNRTLDANYYSFAYTRLQEQDWVELFVHAEKKHVAAVVGWMGYWLQSTGFRNYDAGWAPGMAYVTLDSDFKLAGLEPNVALRAGAWWPKFGYHRKYDTFTLGQFRQLGEQLKLTVPAGDFTAAVVQGVGTSRDGSFNLLAPPPYQSQVGLDLIHYEHLSLAYREYFEVGLHYNSQTTRDPNLFVSTQAGKAYSDAREAYLSTVGGELKVNVPRAGSLWLSPSYVRVKNGWALAEGGVEVMHSLSADGLATNYLGWSGSLRDSKATGSLFNVGFVYENSLSGIQGKPRGSVKPELTLNVFGLFSDVKLDLPPQSVIAQDHIGQFKYGADLELQATDWLGLMLRWDEVNYNLDHDGYVFSAITPRITFSSHFLSDESIYVQYSRYRYGDAMQLAGKWPWGTPLVAGSDIIQGGAYAGRTPDMDVVRLQASVAF